MRHGEASDRTDRLWEAVHSRSRQPNQAYRPIRSNRVREEGLRQVVIEEALLGRFIYRISTKGHSGFLHPIGRSTFPTGRLNSNALLSLKRDELPYSVQ